MAISLRLDDQVARKLALAAKAQGISKSELVRKCLENYLAGQESQPNAWELGKPLFGCFKSGKGDLSVRAKEIAKERIRARQAKTNHR